MKNPLDTIREETTLLELFQSIMSESAYMDTIVKYIFKQQNEIKKMISRKNYNCVYLKLDELNSLLKELNEKIKPRNLKCSIENVSCKELSKMVETLEIENVFICRRCKPPKIFDSEDELKSHREESGHRFISWMPQRNQQLTIIKNNTTCVSVPLFDLIERSGALAEINNRIKPINLKCQIPEIVKVSKGELLNVLEFEPAFMCRQCLNKIFATKEELQKHKNEHEIERKKYEHEISQSFAKRKKEHEEYLKSRDRTR